MEQDKQSTRSGALGGSPVSTPQPDKANAIREEEDRVWGNQKQAPGYESVTFDSGAKRSQVAPFYAAIPQQSLRRLALRATGAPRGKALTDAETGFSYEGGSRGYGYDNWRMGLPLRDTFNHVIDHLYRWLDAIERGVIADDDHLSGAAWGVMFPLMTFESKYAAEGRNNEQAAAPATPRPSAPVQVGTMSAMELELFQIDRELALMDEARTLLTKRRLELHVRGHGLDPYNLGRGKGKDAL